MQRVGQKTKLLTGDFDSIVSRDQERPARRHEVEMVEIGEVEHLEVDADRLRRRSMPGAWRRPRQACRRPPMLAQLVGVAPIAAARRSNSASSSPQHSTSAADQVIDAGSRSIASQAAATLARLIAEQVDVGERRLNSAAYSRGQRRRPCGSLAADDDRRSAGLDRLGQCRRLVQLPGRALERERLAGRCVPETVDDRQLLLEVVEALGDARETGCRTPRARPRTSRRRGRARPDRPTSGRHRRR